MGLSIEKGWLEVEDERGGKTQIENLNLCQNQSLF